MFTKSREKLKRREIIKDKPRSYLLKRRLKKEKMTYELRSKLLKLEKRVPPIHVYDNDDYFPKQRVVGWVSSFVDFCINSFFISLGLLLIWVHIMLMGPTWVMIECLVEPMMLNLENEFNVSEIELEQITRNLLVNDVFALG